MKRLLGIILLSVCTMGVTAQDLREVQQVQSKIDSIQYKMQDMRDSMRLEVKAYRDSLREARRHAYDNMPHDLRIGVGDQLFETLMWRDRGHYQNMPEGYKRYDENFRYTQHCFAEYMYNFNYWYGLGLLVDYSGVIWDSVLRNGKGKELEREVNQSFHNIAIVPTVRFSYYRHEYVSLYSAIGAGLNINTGTELDYKGRKTAVAPALNITLLGVCAGKGRWYGALEVGGMLSFNSAEEVYMLGSRIMTASVGVRL